MGDKLANSVQSVFDLAIASQGPERTAQLLEQLADRLRANQHELPRGFNTPYANTIPVAQQPEYPGDWKTEVRLKSLMRWNAMAMVVKANHTTNVGGHISTYASAATLYEVAFNHFFRGRTEDFPGDAVYFQGHAAPGRLCPRVSRRPADGDAFAEFPPGTRRRRRALVVSASVSDAGFLAVPDRLDGPRPDHVHLPGAV